jgi:hypothetical protein
MISKQTPSLHLVEFFARKGGDVIDANVMEFIHLNVHPCTFSLVLVHV